MKNFLTFVIFSLKEFLDSFLKKLKFIRHLNYITKSQYKVFKRFKLNESSIFLDFGANKGEVTQFIKDNYNCKTESYEPNKSSYKKLYNRFKRSKINKTFNLGVSLKSNKKKLFYHQKFRENQYIYSQSSSFLKNKKNINSKDFSIVKTKPINKILANHKYIDLIKIDIEGYEYDILPEIIKNKKKIKNVLCELHGNPNTKNTDGTIKNNFLTKKYKKIILKLKKKKLLNTWFVEWI